MAAPTAPTQDSIVTEGIKIAGYSTPSTDQKTRAKDEWMQEIKNDIWTRAKDLKFLQSTNILVLTEGAGLVDYPSDFSSDLSMQLLEPTHFGVCQAGGSTTTAKLAADEDMTNAFAVGKEIVIYLTADKTTTYSGFMSNFDTTTKIATFSPEITVSPDATYSYLIVDAHKPITQQQIIRLDELYLYAERGTPYHFYPVGSEDYGQFYLYPVPYWNDSIPRAVRQRYYANLMTLDLAGTLMSTLYSRWRNVFVQGVFMKQLKDDDDKRADKEELIYKRKMADMISQETYGSDLSNLQAMEENNY